MKTGDYVYVMQHFNPTYGYVESVAKNGLVTLKNIRDIFGPVFGRMRVWARDCEVVDPPCR